LVSPPPTSGFGAPTNLSATPDNAGPIALSWTAVAGAVEYDVYGTDATGTSSTLLFTTTANSAENTGVTPGQTNYYKVLPKNAAGTSSGFRNGASAAAPTTTLFTDAFNGTASTSNWTSVGASGAWQFNETTTDTSTTSGGANVPIPANGLSQTNFATAADPQK